MEIFRPFLGHASTGKMRVLHLQPGFFRGRLILTCRGQYSMLILALLVAFGYCTMCLLAVILHTISTRIGCHKGDIFISIWPEKQGTDSSVRFTQALPPALRPLKSALHQDCFANTHRTCWFANFRDGKGRGRRRSWNELPEIRILST